MDVTISSRKVPVSSHLEEVIHEKIGKLDRFLDGLERADVHFFEEKNPRIENKEVCEVTVEGHGHYVRCKVAAPDQYAAVDQAVDKLEHQLHKLKTKVLNRRQGGNKRRGSKTVDVAFDPSKLVAPDAPVLEDEVKIVKMKTFEMAAMTPDDAVTQLELVDHDFYVFTNAVTDRVAVVYLREDGDYGLIDSAE